MEKLDAIEVDEWTESLDSVLRFNGPAATGQLLRHLSEHAQSSRVPLPSAITTPFRNTISPEDERTMPGDLFMERRIRSLVRWNAMAMVMRANDNQMVPHLQVSLLGFTPRLWAVVGLWLSH